MAEVHIVGSLVGGKDFEKGSLFCKWQLITDDGRPDNKRCVAAVHTCRVRVLCGRVRVGARVDVVQPGARGVWLGAHTHTPTQTANTKS